MRAQLFDRLEAFRLATARLEQLGFEQVYDYVLGKADWLAADQPLDEVLAVLDETARRCCVVVDTEQVVLGLLSYEDAAARTAAAGPYDAHRHGSRPGHRSRGTASWSPRTPRRRTRH
ncbi:hypothetical protein AB0I77_34155 [Streptomyces sp. NPDC050619]|uniref:hypothetical protein n=1 Tax=Streptomyces sp. NPDC050619 TaxID=3157214 RepID=UPI00342275F0